MKNFDWKAVLPHVMAVLVFLVLTLVYFSPVFQGKDIKQDDAIGSMAWGKDAKDYHEETGEYSYWSNSMFSGMPCNYTYSPQPTNVFKPVGDFITLNVFGVSRRHIGCIFATFIGSYIFFLALGCRPWLSIAGSIVYTLGSYNFIIISAGHMNKSLVIATMAPLIGGIIMMYRKKLLLGALVTLVFAGLNIYWSHQQMSYYTAIIAAFMAVVYLVYAIKDKWLPYYLKATGVLAVVALLSVAPAVGILLPTADYAKESMRGGSELADAGNGKSGGLDTEYAFRWSYGKLETLTLLVPNLYGSASGISEDGKIADFLRRMDDKVISDVYRAASNVIIENYADMLVKSNPGIDRRTAINYILENPMAEPYRNSIHEQAVSYAQSFPNYISNYWGEQPGTSGPVYAGAIVCLLFILGLIIVRGPEKWWLLAATLFSLVLAWGCNLAVVNEFLFEYMPLYNKFRAPSQALVITTLTMSALALLAVKRIIEIVSSNDKKEREFAKNAIYVSFGVAGGVALLLAVAGGTIFDFVSPGDEILSRVPRLYNVIQDERHSMLVADAWRSFGFIAASAALLLAYSFISKMKKEYMIVLLAVLFLFDMWPVCKRYVNDRHFMEKRKTTEIQITAADKKIHELEGGNHYRVLDKTRGNEFNQSFTSYYHNSVGGYSPAKLSRYEDLIEHQIRKGNNGVLDMLNTKYIIKDPSADGVELNLNAFGHCWLVDNIEWVNDAREEMAALDNVSRATAFVDKRWADKIDNPAQYNNNAAGTIELVEYRNPGNIIYRSSSEAPKLALFSEVYYKTWKAYIDGEEVTPVRANYVLRALPLPAGEHTIEFKCVDELMETSHSWSLYMSIVVGVVLVLLVGAIVYRKVKR